MNNLAEQLAMGPKRLTRPGKIDRILNSLIGEELKAVEEALDSEMPSDYLADVLTGQGFPVSATTIRAYRRSSASKV